MANTFLKTLNAAGLGEHKTGRKGYPTRFEVGDDFEKFVSDLSDAASGTNSDQPDDSSDGEVGSTDDHEDGDRAHSDSGDENVRGELTGGSAGAQGNVIVNINIDISTSDWDTDELLTFIQKVNCNVGDAFDE